MLPEDVLWIMKLKISPQGQQDLLGWNYNEDGLYTVKSGYWLGTHLPRQHLIQLTYGDVDLKQRLWKTQTTPKIKHFVWRLLSRSLATGENLRRRHVTQQSQCQRCGIEEETDLHLFFNCPYAQCVWRSSGISNLIINSRTSTLEEKVAVCLQISSSSRLTHFQDLPLWILWRLWKSRNILIFQQRGQSWISTLHYARLDAQEWRDAGNSHEAPNSHTTSSQVRRRHRWQKPQSDWLKCNVDGSFIDENSTSKAGWVIRDDKGSYKGSVQAKGMKVSSPLESELQAILMSMQFCWSRGYRRVIIEGDCQKAVNLLNNKQRHFGLYNWIREIKWWESRFEDISYQWVGREANQVADKLAKHGDSEYNSFQFHFFVPSFVSNLIHEDYVNSNHF